MITINEVQHYHGGVGKELQRRLDAAANKVNLREQAAHQETEIRKSQLVNWRTPIMQQIASLESNIKSLELFKREHILCIVKIVFMCVAGGFAGFLGLGIIVMIFGASYRDTDSAAVIGAIIGAVITGIERYSKYINDGSLSKQGIEGINQQIENLNQKITALNNNLSSPVKERGYQNSYQMALRTETALKSAHAGNIRQAQQIARNEYNAEFEKNRRNILASPYPRSIANQLQPKLDRLINSHHTISNLDIEINLWRDEGNGDPRIAISTSTGYIDSGISYGMCHIVPLYDLMPRIALADILANTIEVHLRGLLPGRRIQILAYDDLVLVHIV